MSPSPEQLDILILGSGKSGKLLAWHMASGGRRTAVVERRLIGGSCPTINCMPSKNEIWSAKIADLVRHAAAFGTITGPTSTDMARVRQRKREMVEAQIAFHLEQYRKTGVDLVMGAGRFVAPKTLEVALNEGGTRVLSGDRVFVDVGTRAAIPSVPGLSEARPLTHVEVLELGRLPPHLIVIGGGYVGLEFAQAYRRFGSRVTVIHQGSQLVHREEDSDVAAAILQVFRAEEIDVHLEAQPLRVQGLSGEGVSVRVRSPRGEHTVEGSDLLVATGRVPNTSGIGLEVAGVELDARGYIKVNYAFETSAPDVWAMGECAGSPQFTHIAGDDFRIVRDNLAGGRRSKRDRLVPSCLFIDPPLARVGLNEREARRRGVEVRVARLAMGEVLRSQTTGETVGFMKALIDGKSDRILGFTMLGPEAGEVLATVQMAMVAGIPFPALRDAILTHPTMAEGLGPLFGTLPEASLEPERR
jgi:pyruvate/2-oxoglutarate dehydrogenase complex dihydrolipoamide dehydrogenase (E3) component